LSHNIKLKKNKNKMKNLVKRFGQFVNEGHHDSMFSPNAGDDNMLPNRNRYDRYEEEEGGYDDEGNYIKDKMSGAESEPCETGCEEFDERGKCIVCNNSEDSDYYDEDNIDPEHEMNKTMYNRGEEYQMSKIDRQIDRHNMGRMDNMSASELSEAKKQEKIEALDAIDKKFAKMKPAKKSMPMKPMPKKNMEMEEEEEEESSMKPKMLFGKPLKPAKPETKTNKMPLKGGKPAFLSGKK
jgi:hypothetical protein